MRHTSARLAAAAIVLSGTAFVLPAFAQEDMGSNPITEFFDGLGLGAKEKPDIDYQERAPLVPPSSTAALPAPQAKGAARSNPQWPNDPDLQARAERKARANVVPTESYTYRMDRSPRMDPDELGNRRTTGASVPRTASATASDNTIMRTDDISSRPITQTAVPANASRGRLTDPPSGYTTGGATGAPAAAAPEQKPWYKKMFGG